MLLPPVTSSEGVDQTQWLVVFGSQKSDLVLPVQTLDSSELQGDGIVLSLEEQLSAMSITSSPSTSGPDPKDTVSLNGTRFPSHLFEDTGLSTKVSDVSLFSLAPKGHYRSRHRCTD